MSDVVALRSRGTWQGVLNIIFSTGSMIVAPLGGYLADTIGWRWAFIMQFPAIILAFIAALLALHLPPHPTSDLKSKLKRIDSEALSPSSSSSSFSSTVSNVAGT
ncbi:hypothetical protein E1B28_012849 [Marasmius oreades]|uniref:Major facilitator superfamily (MFS) profile domain-containing protein n=1 Tax=Marasmius oreades TaxID=181124 RepID=A0A9P7RSG8_9AGAR|nr:uncharacterized protein E1B28_012849 [Marasmius oreades]KAG7088904.1 hypothetical protein E1B28_012849 [Marasmius oreades]